jgi:hypothetical protein
MSGTSGIGSFAYRWNLVASGIASVDAITRTSDSFHQSSDKNDTSASRDTVESATITKRMSDGDMIILRYDRRAKVSAYSTANYSGKQVNLTA